ncbi:PREDICTED: serine protease snake-like [Nicrophorus vespilloides]|uniref:Serine protease snake-like n=1 Tax=Nicrophorus vespilloides TaxID=110193 RepID=A0ABM1MQC1_NICVS|nr:PREDICTED: serine protease snake-like [Nicrophorus vespilloides]
MSQYVYSIVLLIAISSQGYAQTKDSKCDDPGKWCENIWYCKEDSYPEKYKTCGNDGLVDRVCCDPIYNQTKSRKQCDALYKKIEIDEYGNRDYDSIKPSPDILTESFPYVAALGHRNGSKTDWLCAGSLISNKYILTAAKCLNGNVNIVRLGDLDLNRDDDEVDPQEYGVIKEIKHPKYIAPAVYNDIGLIELNSMVRITKFVKPGCIFDESELRDKLWQESGYKDPGSKDVLTSIGLIELAKRACHLYFNSDRFANQIPFGLDDDTQLCGSSVYARGDCQTDIGGPLSHRDLNYIDANFIIGVVTIPKPCSTTTNKPGLYTRVSNYAPWIESIVFPES